MNNPKVILFEHKYHEELLLPQVLSLLEENIDVHLICSEKIASNQSLDTVRKRINFHTYASTSSLFAKIKLLWQVPGYAKKNKIDAIIVNTLDSNLTRNLLKRLPFLKRAAIVHNADKFVGTGAYTKNLRVVDRAFTLTHYIAYFLQENHVKATPISLCKFGNIDTTTPPQNDLTEKTINIIIPGQIDFARRDYQSLLSVKQLPAAVKFIFLGNASKNDGPSLIREIRQKKLDDHFMWFEHFVDHDQFIKHIATADFIMPLLHPTCDAYEKYRQCKSSAAFMWSSAFSIPMLMEQGFEHLSEYQSLSTYYNINELERLLENLPPRLRADSQPKECEKNNYAQEILSLIEPTREP